MDIIEPPHIADDRRFIPWLQAIERTRDMTQPLNGGGEEAAILRRFVDGLRAEMHDFRATVEAAAESASLNAAQLSAIVENTAEQSAVVEQAAAAIAEIDRGAVHVAETTEELRRLTSLLTGSTASYDAGIDGVLERLEALASTVETAATFAAAIHTGAGGITAFVDQLRRIARQARLLAINAAIEAAHLGDSGQGFVIVANEVKALGTSTAESAQNVAAIEAQLQSASAQVASTIGESAAIVRGLAGDLAAARAQSAQTREQVREFDGSIVDVATIAAEQSAGLSAIAAGVEGIARDAHAVAAAAERAGRLALDEGLQRLRATISAHRLGPRPNGVEEVRLDVLSAPTQAAAAALRARVDADQREILRLVTALAVAIARNSYEWRAIGEGLGSLGAQLDVTMRAVDETASGAAVAASASQRMRASLDAMRHGFGNAVDALERTLERAVRVRETVESTESFVHSTSAAAERAAAILDLIDTISSETTLLSLNAAIEAAHAGSAGSGFGIIADEIRSLAETTSRATQHIAAIIAGISDATRSMTTTAAEALEQTGGVHAQTASMQNTVAQLRTELDGTLIRASEVGGIVEQQVVALGQVRTATALALHRVERDTLAATDSRRIELALLGMRAHALAARRPLGTVAEQMRAIGLQLAADLDNVFEAAIASGAIRLEDCFDTEYVEITGPAIARLGRLFDVSKVPVTGFNPAKFATRYDRAVEDGVNALIDRAVTRDSAIEAMFAVDLNGYCFGHYRACRQDWTGDYATDLRHNRIKRFFEDELSLRCSRTGLGAAADTLPKRTPYAQFREHGGRLRREGERPWAIYTYARDTGTVYNDLSVGIFAQGERVATIRIIYDADVV
ncbi:MAG TPA: methyl-accepting chemotaxis protein [Candidatus Acidoferrum sp.]|nr:methyl-accepting chemotaxis protein [Candidatus Acidoferrum sp.]